MARLVEEEVMEEVVELWDPAPLSFSPASSLLADWAANGLLTPEELDSASGESHVFSSHLLETEQRIRSKRELGQVRLEAELLRLERDSADVAHKYYLSQRFEELQAFAGHLQELLREQGSLRQRLMKPFCQTSLPIEAHLHRYVVELVQMVRDFIEKLEGHLTTVRTLPSLADNVAKLTSGLAQLLTQVTEVELLSQQVLQWRDRTPPTQGLPS